MGMILKIALVLILLLMIGAAIFLVPTIWFKPWSLDHFYARTFLRFALKRPMVLSQIRILEPMGLHFHNNDLNNFSVQFQLQESRWLDRELEILRRYNREGMDESHTLSTDILDWYMSNNQQGNLFMFHDYPVNQLFGIQSRLPDFMLNIHQINEMRDAKNYVTRVSKFGVAFDQVIESLRVREEKGIVPPRFVIQRVLKEMRDFIALSVEEHPLYTNFNEKLAKLTTVADSKKEELTDRLQSEIETTVYSAYGRLIEYFDELEDRATTDDGVWKLPDGEAYYAYMLRNFTTTKLSAEEIHQLGLREVAKIREEMSSILKGEGYQVTDLDKTIQALGEEERFQYPDTDEGRVAVLADYQAIVDEILAGLGDSFDVRPKATIEVQRIPEFKEETSPLAYYQQPPFDGSKPGVFFVNLRDVDEHRRFRMRTLTYHEAVPGHHFQIAIAQELEDVPFFRRIVPFTAYIEGWALYAETVAAEHGFLDDPFDRLGYLIDQQLRAVRLVVDTGIHSKRWTRDEAIQYMVENTGMPESEVVAEVERYIVLPGQACAYKVGQLKILELRERAQEELGTDFDLSEFHNVVLKNGAVPLGILERLVDRWIESHAAS